MAESIRTQPERVLDWLKEHPEGITQLDAYSISVTRLAEIIRLLKCAGVAISDVWEAGKNKYGQTTRYKRYFLKGETDHA